MFTTACGKGPEGVAATVNGVEIPEEKYVELYAMQRNQYVQMAGSEDILKEAYPNDESKTIDEAIKETALNSLVEMEVIKQDAEKKGIKVDEAKVNEAVESVKSQYGSEEEFNKALEEAGLTLNFFKEDIANSLLSNDYATKITEEVKPTEEEIKKYYDDNKDSFFKAKAAHILVATKDEATKLKKELDKGADFAKLAKENSTDESNAASGGDLGEFTNGTMVEQFDSAVKVMKDGEISDPVQTDFGYHIIKLESKTPRTFEEAKSEVEQTVAEEKFTNYINDLQKAAKVKKYVKPTDEVVIPEELQLKATPATEEPAEEAKNEATNKAENKPANEVKNETANKTENAANKNTEKK